MSFIKKYVIEILGIYFSFILLLLALVSIRLFDHKMVHIPLLASSIAILSLILGFIIVYTYTMRSQVKGWRLASELFIMLAALCASLSDGFWICLTIAAIIIIVGTIKENTLKLNYPILYLWAILLIICIISSFFATESFSLSIGATAGILLYMVFFIAVYNQQFLKERGMEFVHRIGVLLSFSIISTVIFSLWHLLYFNADIFVLIFKFQQMTGYGNSFGMASIYGQWPTHSSAFLCLSVWVLLGIRFYSGEFKKKSTKIILNFGILLSLIGIMATLSRNAFLFLVISLIISAVIFLSQKSHRKLIFPIMGGACGLGGVLYFYLTHFAKWADLLTHPLKQVTIAERLNQYKFGIEQLSHLENQWTGIGLMNFGPLYRRILNDATLPDYLHQLLLSVLLEIGYLGFGVFIILLTFIGIQILKHFKQNQHNPIFVIIFFSWLGMGIFDNWLYFMWSSSLFMILIALGSKPNLYDN